MTHLDDTAGELEDEAGPTILDRAAIMQAATAAAPATADTHVPELGGMVRVREMNGALRNRLEAAMVQVRTGGDSKHLERTTAQIIAACVVDETNRPILKEQDARQIFTRNPRAAFRLREAIFAVSAIDESDAEALAEGFGDDQSDGSTSG